MKQLHHLNDRMVIKTAKGAMSKGVALSVNKTDLIQKAKKISRSRNWFSELWNFKNTFKYKGFIPDSKYRNKFVIQNFIPGLDSDWKILIYGLKYYALKRNVRKNDFRASGSGLLKFTPEIPNGILDFAKLVYQTIDVPQLSIDVAFDGNDFHLIEFQALYFGSYTLESSPFYYLYNKGWNLINEKSVLESVFADSVVQYIANKNE
jgi:glutathione synthase/RimK-type ligase-like ATP-grasp enzyme